MTGPLDFVSDTFTDCRRLRNLTVVDDFTRACVALGADTSLSGLAWLVNWMLFTSLDHAREILKAWQHDYNNHRPHSGLGWLTPSEFANYLRSEQATVVTGNIEEKTPLKTGT